MSTYLLANFSEIEIFKDNFVQYESHVSFENNLDLIKGIKRTKLIEVKLLIQYLIFSYRYYIGVKMT